MQGKVLTAEAVRGRTGEDADTVRRLAEQVARAGMHQIRHFYASALIRSGLSVTAVSARLGANPTLVLKTYAHLWHDDEDRTRQAIEDLFKIQPDVSQVRPNLRSLA